MNPNSKIDVHILLPIWGEEFTSFFTNKVISFLFSEKNTKFFLSSSDKYNFKLILSTTYEDSIEIKKSFISYANIFSIEYYLIDGYIDTNNPHKVMTECYIREFSKRSENKKTNIFLFLTPDSIWSAGTFESIFSLVETHGAKVVVAPGFRVNKEASYLLRSFNDQFIDKKNLANFVMKNLHQLSLSHVFNSRKFINSACSHIYFLGHSYLIARCFHLHPILVVADKKYNLKLNSTIDGDMFKSLKIPLKRYYVSNGDFFAVEFTEKTKKWWGATGYPRLKSMIRFAIFNVNKYHLHFFSQSIVIGDIRSLDTDITILSNRTFNFFNKYKMLILLGDFIFSRLLSVRSFFKIFKVWKS